MSTTYPSIFLHRDATGLSVLETFPFPENMLSTAAQPLVYQ